MNAAPRAARGAGFTLVEVLVALVIVAFGMGAVLAALTSAADSTIWMRDKTFAEWVGLNQLATERLQASLPATGTKDGDVDFGGKRWHWQETVENIDIPGIRRLTIRVRHADATAAQPPASKQAAGDVSWLATVVGFRGDALQSPLDQLADWDGPGQTAPAPTPTPTPTPTP